MFDRLIENWLINVNELGYQIPFCQVLLLNGYRILHISRHGRGEHGVDIAARSPQGQLTAYQLKCGDIRLPDWRKMRDEVAELVQLPVHHPGVRKAEAHIPYLVTNGEILGDAVESIDRYAVKWESQGYPHLGILQRHELLSLFVRSHGSYLPADIVDFRQFVELYVSDFYDRVPRERLAAFLAKLVSDSNVHGRQRVKRMVESMALMSSYILEQYERVRNFISAAEGWTIVGATIMHVAEQHKLKAKDYEPSLRLAWTALERNLYDFQADTVERKNFIELSFLEGDMVNIRGARTAITLGWLAAIELIRRIIDIPAFEKGRVRDVIKREIPNLRISGESDWPIIALLSIYVEDSVGSHEGESLLVSWVQQIVAANGGRSPEGLPNPYWLQEKVLALHYRRLPPYEREHFEGQSYTVLSALDMLVRRMCRQQVGARWARVSRLGFCNYVPDNDAEWFLWRSTKGDLQIVHSKQPKSWGEWRAATRFAYRDSVPRLLLAHPEWIPPFALTYPHRMNRELTAAVDAVFGERADLASRD